jgi:cytoskeletal protein RodZ
MARTSTLPSRMHRGWLSLATIGIVVVVVAAIAAWALFVHSGNAPARSVPATTSPSATSQGPRTDPFGVNEWAAATAAMLRYHDEHPECYSPSRPWTPTC